ncbi:MAG: hypothetical protein DRQ51_01330 [Gammaproteobacteria bacterium]|nr:MAG: hypothetical protein DRQ51_01330 [Gammaproteobacteria bacterium]
MKNNLFILISTGQQLSNLPPVIQKSQQDDRIIWIESDLSIQKNWTKGANEVLKKRGLVVLESIKVANTNEPKPMIAAIEKINLENYNQIYAITNGGQKFSPIALFVALNRLQKNYTMLYANNKPVNLWEYDKNFNIKKTTYDKFLSLDEIFLVRGFKINKTPNIFWQVDDKEKPVPEIPAEYKDQKSIYKLHQDHYVKNQFEWFDMYAPRYQNLSDIFGAEKYKIWQQTATGFLQQQDIDNLPSFLNFFRKYMGQDHFGIEFNKNNISEYAIEKIENLFKDISHNSTDGTINHISTHLESLYGRVKNILEYHQKKYLNKIINPHKLSRIGPIFEKVVENKIYRLLNETAGFNGIVSQAAAGIKIFSRLSGAPYAEFDILLVLKNAILIHLECKSYEANTKDMNARIATLQNSTSNLAQMLITAPIYTEQKDNQKNDWVAGVIGLKNRMDNIKSLTFIPFTLTGQPTEYTTARGITYDIPDFADSLQQILQKYISDDASKKTPVIAATASTAIS